MNALPRWVLQHRHAVIAALAAVLLIGLDARYRLPVQLFPDTDPPMVTVITPYPGMAAEDVEENLSKLMEEEFAAINGVRSIRSSSQEGLSVVEVELHYGASSATGAVEVQNAINRIRADLPAAMGEPQIQEFSSAARPIVTLALTSASMPLTELRELAENRIRDRLNLVPGVAAVDVLGANRLQLDVRLHRDKLYGLGVAQQQVVAALRDWNLAEAGGRIRRGRLESVVRFDLPLIDPADAADLVIQRRGDQVLRLADVAEVRLAAGEPRSAYRHNGRPAIAVQVLKRDEANTVEVADRLFAVFEELRQAEPDVIFTVAEDDSAFTRVVINSMTATVLSAIALTVIVVLLFLGDPRQSAIVAASIPIAFLATFALMRAAGLQLDMVTMSAIILAIGLLVDDSIVVLENIHRHREQGRSPAEAAIKGTGEILGPSTGGTLTTLAVLLPLTLLGGFVGQLFRPLALTLVFALSASLVVSLTVVPLMAAAWARPAGGQGLWDRLLAPFDRVVAALRDIYLGLLAAGLRRPVLTVGLPLALLAASMVLLRMGGSEMLPRFDSGSFRVLVDVVPGTPLQETQATVSAVEQALLEEAAVVNVSTRIGYERGARYLGGRGAMDSHQAEISVDLTPRNRRAETQWEIMDRAREKVRQMPGITLGVFQEQGGTARPTTSAPMIIEISGPQISGLDTLADEMTALLRGIPGVRDPYKNWALDRPEVNMGIHRERAAELGLIGTEIARSVHRALDGQAVTPYRQRGLRDLEVVVRYQESDRTHWEGLLEVVLTGAGGTSVPLSEVATFEPAFGPRLISRENFRRTLEVRSWITGERPLSHIVGDAQRALDRLALPDGYAAAITGEQADMAEAQGRLLRALAMSALAVYLLLMVQFRSLGHPLVVMSAVPLQFIGVAAALMVAGKYLSMPALLGIIMLLGVVVNNSIILVTFVLERLAAGAPVDEALRDAVDTRFRPVMMTALSTVAGMLPLALEWAVGSERFSPLATVIVGGILASTLLTLVIVPVLMKTVMLRGQTAFQER